jgi:hypothetical protein
MNLGDVLSSGNPTARVRFGERPGPTAEVAVGWVVDALADTPGRPPPCGGDNGVRRELPAALLRPVAGVPDGIGVGRSSSRSSSSPGRWRRKAEG